MGRQRQNPSMFRRLVAPYVAIIAVLAALLGLGTVGSGAAPHHAHTGQSSRAAKSFKLPELNRKRLSQGARMWFARAERKHLGARNDAATHLDTGTDVDAADPNEDLAAGQSETAIAAKDNFVMAAWNDATSFLYFDDSTQLAASGTGVGFSTDNGRHFKDLVGLPNNQPNEAWSGDPSVVSLGDGIHFIVTSLYFPAPAVFFSDPAVVCARGRVEYDVAVSVATANQGNVQFSNPIVAARSANLCNPTGTHFALDKPFASYNAKSQTLAISYTRFNFFNPDKPVSTAGAIKLVRAHVSPASPIPQFGQPITVWPAEDTIVNTGASPAVANNGDVYVAWERNLGGKLIQILARRVPSNAAGPDVGQIITLGQSNADPYGGVKSLNNVPIAGYSRGFGQDFPAIAYNPTNNGVVIEWNDASYHPLGDIFLRSLDSSLQFRGPVMKVNDDNSYALHFMPAVSVRSDGSIASSWYDRRLSGPSSTVTYYFGEVRSSAGLNPTDFKITSAPTDWAGTSSWLSPNFGDYTGNASTGTTTYFSWADGRLGIPQPFVASR